ncbi:MAG: hypothetical protein ACRD94_02955 [Nitrosopumilaceae archaeon]
MQKIIVTVLICISAVGVLGIPLGDPKFIVEGIALELVYVGLTILSARKIRCALIPNIAVACLVIAGNTLSPKHTEIMLSLTPLYNAIILIVGGYILQALLLVTSLLGLKNRKQLAIKDSV